MTNHIRDILPLDHTLPDIGDAICEERCHVCKKRLEGHPFRNDIAEYEYRKTGACQDCQDMYLANPSKHSEVIFGLDSKPIGISEPYITFRKEI